MFSSYLLYDTTFTERIAGHTPEWDCVRFSPNGLWLAYCTEQNDFVVCKSIDNTIIGRGENISCLEFSSDSRMLAIGSEYGFVDLYSLPSNANEQLRSIRRFTVQFPVRAIAFSPDRTALAIMTSAVLELVRLTGELIRYWRPHCEMGPTSVVFSSDGRYLIHNAFKKELGFMDLKTNQEFLLYDPSKITAIHCQSDCVTVGHESGDITIWSIKDRRIVRIIPAKTDHSIRRIAYSPDGQYLVAVNSNRDAIVYHLATMKSIEIDLPNSAAGIHFDDNDVIRFYDRVICLENRMANFQLLMSHTDRIFPLCLYDPGLWRTIGLYM